MDINMLTATNKLMELCKCVYGLCVEIWESGWKDREGLRNMLAEKVECPKLLMSASQLEFSDKYEMETILNQDIFSFT